MKDFYSLRDMRHYLLLPLSFIYIAVIYLRGRFFTKRRVLSCPVVCVGNAVMGGAGKTPVVRMVAHYFKKRGKRVHIITRGYGRRRSGNFAVESFHTVYDVGDEALMLAQDFPVWVADDRFSAGEMAIVAGAEILLLDDGYQDISLHKDFHILVTDMGFGYGNGLVFPAGCLREPLSFAYGRADLHILLTADGEESLGSGILPKKSGKGGKGGGLPQIAVQFSAVESSVNDLPAGNWVVFCGLARCEKFFATVEKLAMVRGVHIVARRCFRDHHFYSSSDKRELWGLADKYDASLVTTEKDFVRFADKEQSDLSVIRGEIIYDEDALDKFLGDKFLQGI